MSALATRSPDTSSRIASQRSIAVRTGAGPQKSDEAIHPSRSVRSCSSPAARACSAASSQASAAASARASSQYCQPRSRSALQSPCSSPAARNTGTTRSTTAEASSARRRRAAPDPEHLLLDQRVRERALVARRLGGGHRLGEHALGVGQPARLDQDGAEVREQRGTAGLAGRQQRDGALQQRRGRAVIAAALRPAPRRLEPVGRARRERAGLRAGERRARTGSARPARGGSRRSPRSRSPVPAWARSSQSANRSWSSARVVLRQRPVGGIADQDVPEAERVVVAERRAAPAGSGRAA